MKKLILIPIFIFLLTLISVNSQLLTTDDAVAVYRFEDITGDIAIDSSTNDLDGSVLGGAFLLPSKGTNGTGDFAITLDGIDDFIRVLDNDILDLNNFSITAWVNISDVATTHTVFSKRATGTNITYEGEVNGASDKFTTRANDVDNSCFSESSTLMFVDQWIHVALVYATAANQFQIFIDGVQETTDGCTAIALGNEADLTIGVKTSLVDFFNGSIDELYIFNFTLTPTEVTDIFNNGINITVPINTTNLDVFLSKNPIEILEEFTLFANYTNATSNLPVLNATCFANSSRVGGGQSGFGRGILGIGELSTINNAVHTQVNDIFGNNTLRVDIDNLPLGKASYAVNFRFHAHNQTPDDQLRVFATCHNNLTFSNFTFLDAVNGSDAVISTSDDNNTIWGFKNVVIFGTQVATPNCSIVFESINTSLDKHWMIADTVSTTNLNNSFTSNDFGETYVLRTNANERSPFVDAGFGLDVPNETTMLFNSTSNLYFLSNIRHGRPFDFNDTVFCSANNFVNATDFVITNVQDNVLPITQILSISPDPVIFNQSNVTIFWSANDPELLTKFINVSFPDGSLLIQSENNPLFISVDNLTVLGNYSVTVFANDTGGLFSTDNDTFQVRIVDTTPPIITLIFPPNGTVNNTIPLNITFSVTDNFPNDITCILLNSTTQFDTGLFTQSTNSNLTLAEGFISLSQNFPNLELTCFDNTLFNNSATLNLNYTLDTVPPVIVFISPLNNSKFNKELISLINIAANCTDVPVFRFNITIDNSTDRIFDFESRTPVNNIISINEQLDITNIGLGFYDVTYQCSDPHTTKLSGDYNVKTNLSDFEIKWVTPAANEFKIKYIQDSLVVTDFGSIKAITNDRYNFFFNTDTTETKTTRTFTFELKSRKPVTYLKESSYSAHFISGNNFIDFELPSDPDAHYIVTLNSNGDYEIAITTVLTKLNFNSVGDLNLVTATTSFEIFADKPLEEFFKVDVCAFDSLQNVFIFSFIMLLGIIVIIVGWLINSSAVSFLGAMMFLFMGFFIFACSQIFAILIILTSLSMMAVFVLQGAKGRFGISGREDAF